MHLYVNLFSHFATNFTENDSIQYIFTATHSLSLEVQEVLRLTTTTQYAAMLSIQARVPAMMSPFASKRTTPAHGLCTGTYIAPILHMEYVSHKRYFIFQSHRLAPQPVSIPHRILYRGADNYLQWSRYSPGGRRSRD